MLPWKIELLGSVLRLFLGDWHCDIAVCAQLGYRVSCENVDPGSAYFGKIETRDPNFPMKYGENWDPQ